MTNAIECAQENIKHNKNKLHQIIIGANTRLTLRDSHLLATQQTRVLLNKSAYPLMEHSHAFLKSCIEQHMPIYGVNTNFGDQVKFLDANIQNSQTEVSYESIVSRQENLIRSMACSLGTPVAAEIIRVAIMLRSHCLGQGYSGVTPFLVEAMLDFLNAGITPIVNNYGSIGASGDLIPLASIAAAMIGEDVDVSYQNQIMKAPAALALAGLTKLTPQLRDSLAMINGTSFMTAIASLTLYKLNRLFTQMLSAIAMTLEAMLVISSAYHPLVHKLKHHTGEIFINNFMLKFWENSKLLSDLTELRLANRSTESTRPVQDYYSLRSVAQGFGTFHENLLQATRWIEDEMNSVNDNPVINAATKEIYHGANFMGYYVTDACDMLKMNIAQASTWLHALLANLLHARKNIGLPTNLAEDPAVHNGFRSLQLLATSLTVQNRKLAQTHQSFTLPTEGDNQDVNSLGTHAALDLQEAVNNLQRLTAISLIASAQALEIRGIANASSRAQVIFQTVRTCSPKLVGCRPMTDEIETLITLLEQEKI
jgi:histidine ammonia-lyase